MIKDLKSHCVARQIIVIFIIMPVTVPLFQTCRDLMSWINGIRGLVSSDELAKDVTGAEALLERHQVLNVAYVVSQQPQWLHQSLHINVFSFLCRNTGLRLMPVLELSRPLSNLANSCWHVVTTPVLRSSRNWRLWTARGRTWRRLGCSAG